MDSQGSIIKMLFLSILVYLNHIQEAICEIESDIENRHNSAIGFTAWCKQSQEITVGQRLNFTGLIINEGNGYIPARSVFICPQQGVYFLSLNLRRSGSLPLGVRVLKNQDSLMYLYSTYGENPFTTVSNSILTSCEVGDTIYVEGMAGNQYSVYGTEYIPYSSFTIFLLYESQEINSFHTFVNGFSMNLMESQEYQAGDVIQFNDEIFTDGNYLFALNRYNCSREGIYFVNVNSHLFGSAALQLEIEVSGSTFVRVEDISSDGSGEAQNPGTTVTNNGLLYCNEGDNILVKSTGSGSIYGSGQRVSTFSGMWIGPGNEFDVFHSTVVGFSVYKTTVQSCYDGDVISFEGTLWDNGGFYNHAFDRFRCPSDGLYFVSINLKRYNTGEVAVDVLRQNSIIILRLADTDYFDTAWHTASHSGLTRCFEGDFIQVKAYDYGNIYGSENEPFSTFTIVKIA